MYPFFAAGDEIRSRSPFLTAPEVQRLLVVATVHQAVHDLLRRWPGGRPQHKARPKLALRPGSAEPELQVVDLASLGVQASRVGTALLLCPWKDMVFARAPSDGRSRAPPRCRQAPFSCPLRMQFLNVKLDD